MTSVSNARAAAPKRFYTTASIEPTQAGYALRLDGRPARTPARAELAAPTKALGDALAAEWDSQGETVELRAMALTRLLSTAIDRGADEGPAWREEIVRFAGADLLCYRAEAPAELADRQQRVWGGFLTDIDARRGLVFASAEGVIAVEQPPATLNAVRSFLDGESAHRLIALKSLTEIAGSFVLALAVADRAATAEEAFAASRLDETYQAEQWGIDAEAEAREAALRSDFLATARFLALLG